MTGMVERMAAAMFDAKDPGLWVFTSVDTKESFRALARTAILAMREPTKAMVDGAYVAHETYEFAPEPKAWCGLGSAYRAMIDAALAEPQS